MVVWTNACGKVLGSDTLARGGPEIDLYKGREEQVLGKLRAANEGAYRRAANRELYVDSELFEEMERQVTMHHRNKGIQCFLERAGSNRDVLA